MDNARFVVAIMVLAAFALLNKVSFDVSLPENITQKSENQELVVSEDEEELSPELQNVKEEFQKIESSEDKVLIHKLFAGAAEYLEVCETMVHTSQFDPVLGRVQTSYGWDRERYPKFTDVVSDYLINVEYDEPKELSTSRDRREFAKIFKGLARATKNE